MEASHRDPFTVAGVPVQHQASAPALLPQCIIQEWTGSRVDDVPLTVHHGVGSTAVGEGALIVEAPPPHGSYYRLPSGDVAIQVPGDPSGGRKTQLLATLRRGLEYSLVYEDGADVPSLQREWHRTLLMLALPLRRRGVLVHAAGLILSNGNGVLCPGVSGVGKSTLVRTLMGSGVEGIRALSDDRVALTEGGTHPQLWGTPWYSSAQAFSEEDAPCAAIVFPAHGASSRLTTIPAPEAARRMLRTIAIPFWDAEGTDFALALLDRLVRSVPAFEFAYSPSPAAGRHLIAALTGAR